MRHASLVVLAMALQLIILIIYIAVAYPLFTSSSKEGFHNLRGVEDKNGRLKNSVGDDDYGDDDDVICEKNTVITPSSVNNDDDDNNVCTIYMGPTSIPENNGYGIYTAKPFLEGTTILRSDGPAIPIVDPPEGTDWISLFSSYYWAVNNADEVSYEADFAADLGITFGSLPNHHSYLGNLGKKLADVPYDDSVLNRSVDWGAGGFSYHKGRDFIAGRDIRAGEELFLTYFGPNDKRHVPSWAREEPGYYDYVDGGEILSGLLEELGGIRKKMTRCENKRVRLSSKEEKTLTETLSTIRKVVSHYSPKTASMLPLQFPELERIFQYAESSTSSSNLSDGLTREFMNTRSPDWLQERGLCLDNMVPGRSTILPQAGFGAMSSRSLKKGDLIVPVPMLQITNRDVLAIPHDDSAHANTSGGVQLLMNYCFGHDESSLLLCPMTNAVLINHCSKRKPKECGPSGEPNAEYRWAVGWKELWGDSSTMEWLNMTLEEMDTMPGRGLAMEIIATRDIQPGEEIFMDYGSKWEEAWDRHVAEWNPPRHGSPFEKNVSVKKLNDDLTTGRHRLLPELLSGDMRKYARHSKIFTACLYWEDGNETTIDSQEKENWKKLDDADILSSYGEEGSHFRPHEDLGYDGIYWPCSVIGEQWPEDGIGDATATVRIFQSKMHRYTEWFANDIPRFLSKYPITSVRYFNRPYRSDQHLPGAFRHSIEIKDDIFPAHWKNRKSRN